MEPEEKVNILLVDDQPGKLLTYHAVLEELGENLVSANSAREALEQLLKDDFAVILVDVFMPEQNGFELVEMIREHHRFKKTAIIFISAVQMDEIDFIKGYASGAVDYVSVPIIPEILRAKVAIFVDLFRKTRQLEKMNAELEDRVNERTAKLKETEEALRETDRRKDVFMATLAHELRNPLAPIRGGLDVIRLAKGDPKVTQEVCEVVDRQLNQLIRLVDDLLDVNRINTGKLELKKTRNVLNLIIRDAVDACRGIIDSKRHELEVIGADEEIFIEADPIRLTQVFSNLLNNAAKYSNDVGRITIRVEHDISLISVSVKDEGLGIAAKDLPYIFDMFSQVKSSQHKATGGLGIGLSLVHGLVQLHGGTVMAKSAGSGKGSEFIVTLPIRSEGDFPPASREVTPLQNTTKRRILVVDDNEDVASMLAKVLQFMGNETDSTNDGASAIEIVKTWNPDIVFLDLGMPVMDGLEVAARIRSEKLVRQPMLVALSGWSSEDDREKTSQAGFDLHLRKPIEMDRIITLLDSSEIHSQFSN
jgi:signal transduction histidine kinase